VKKKKKQERMGKNEKKLSLQFFGSMGEDNAKESAKVVQSLTAPP